MFLHTLNLYEGIFCIAISLDPVIKNLAEKYSCMPLHNLFIFIFCLSSCQTGI